MIDYYGFGKAGYYYARRVYAPVLASIQELPGGEAALWVTNDTLQEVRDRLDLRLLAFDGKVLWSHALDVVIAPNSSQEVWRGPIEGGTDRFVSVSGSIIPRNRTFLADIKDLELPPVFVEAEFEQIDPHHLTVRLRAGAFAYFVHLSTGLETTAFSDNFFDLEPGVVKTVAVTDDEAVLHPDMIDVRQYIAQSSARA